TAAGGLFAFIVSLGVISKFADRTHTGNQIMLYENAIAWGGILGNICFLYQIPIPGGRFLMPFFGILAGIFVGCWSIALAEIINIFPIFIRRIKILKGIPYIILSIAIGKGMGAFIFFYNSW
ncbi:MAG: stage V sporulation protein AB, partial [Lachnospiraceae bacterium]